jgi:hypothetical protein
MKKLILSLLVILICSVSYAQNAKKEIDFNIVQIEYKSPNSTTDKNVKRFVAQINLLNKNANKNLFDALNSNDSSKWPPIIEVECMHADCEFCYFWCGVLLNCI